ncbi:CaiB/BaiF CoA transferase family protein [Roseobacteraceae bacterium NS-SX3]
MRPFEGLRVLDLTHVFAGPFATFQLGVLGAEVIKIEPVDQPDMTRWEGADPALNAAGMGLAFQAQGGGKKTLALDLKSGEGQALFERLVQGADVVVQNYTLAAAEKLGLTYERLSAVKPDLIYCAVSGYGQTGPKRAHPAYDNVIQAYTGMMAANGHNALDAVKIGPAVADYGTGVQAALAIAAALYGRLATGEGRYIDVSMADAALMLQNSGTVQALAAGHGPRPHGSRDPEIAGYSSFDTAEGELMVGAYTNRQMAGLMRSLGLEAGAAELEATPRAKVGGRRDRDSAVLAGVLKTRTAAEWEVLMNARNIPAARVRHLEESLAEEQFSCRQVVQEVEGRRLTVAGFAYGRGGPQVDHAPRPHGADSAAVLAAAGVTEAEFERLKAAGVTA